MDHKEDRFLIPLVPYLFIAAGIGFSHWRESLDKIKDRQKIRLSYFLILVVVITGLYKYQKQNWNLYGDNVNLYSEIG